MLGFCWPFLKIQGKQQATPVRAEQQPTITTAEGAWPEKFPPEVPNSARGWRRMGVAMPLRQCLRLGPLRGQREVVFNPRPPRRLILACGAPCMMIVTPLASNSE